MSFFDESMPSPATMLVEVMRAMKHEIERGEGIEKQLDAMCEYMSMPRGCKDSAGNALMVGDVLSGGSLEKDKDGEIYKRVMEIGFRWALLSKCYKSSGDENAKTNDGRWYETSIIEREWKKI